MSNETITVRDGEHTIEVRRPSALEKMRIFKILPKGCDEKLLYVSMVFIAASVRKYDGAPIPDPHFDSDLERTIALIGDSGVDAVQKSLAPDPSDRATQDLETAAGN